MNVVLYDLDGTLVRFVHQLGKLREQLLRICDDRGLPRFEGLLLEGLTNMVDNARQRDGDAAAVALQEQCDALCVAAEQASVERAELLPDARETLATLRDRGYRQGVVSRAHGSYVHPVVARLGLGEYLDIVISREMVKYYKPHPQALNVALRLMGLSGTPEFYYMVGDHPMDMQAAIQAGATPVAVLTGEGDPAELSAMTELVLPGVGQLPEVIP